MPTIVQLIAILALGYLSAHFLFGRLQSRFFFTSGFEYIVLGVLAGPQVTHIMTPEVVLQLSPMMSLALGSLGLLYGLQLKFKDPREIDAECYRVAGLEILATLTLVGGAFAVFFWYTLGGGGDWIAVFSAALVLGTTAAVSAPTALEVVVRHYSAQGRLAELMKTAIGFNQVLGIAIFGLVFCILHVGQSRGIEVTRTEWVVVSILFGIVLGLLFFLFLGREEGEQRLLLALMGIVIFSSGSAYYLNLSPLFINLVLGIMLANLSRNRERLLHILHSVERPIYVVVLVFAGAAWRISDAFHWQISAGLVLVYVLLRYLGKLLGGYVAHRTALDPRLLPARVGLGFLSQGGVAIAMAINYRQVYQNEFTDIIFTCVLASVLYNEFISQQLTRDILVDAGEIGAA